MARVGVLIAIRCVTRDARAFREWKGRAIFVPMKD